MARSKKKAAPVEAHAADAAPTAPKMAIKVLKGGESWHGGSHRWSLPTQTADGSWTPGEWTPTEEPDLCETGWHLTRQPACWWSDSDDITAYVAEYDGAVSGDDTSADASKFAAARVRLLRPMSHAELADVGVFLSGVHEAITKGVNYVRGGTIQDVRGGTINYVSGGTIQYVSGGTINYVRGGTIQDVRGGTIQDVRGGTIQYVSGGTIQYVSGGTIQDVRGGTIQYVSGGTIQYVSGGTIWYVSGGTIQYVSGGTIQYVSGGTITAHSLSSAVIVIRWGAPTVTLRSLASALDYRNGKRPVHHLADEGQVLTIAPDGSVTQAPEVQA